MFHYGRPPLGDPYSTHNCHYYIFSSPKLFFLSRIFDTCRFRGAVATPCVDFFTEFIMVANITFIILLEIWYPIKENNKLSFRYLGIRQLLRANFIWYFISNYFSKTRQLVNRNVIKFERVVPDDCNGIYYTPTILHCNII